MTAKAVIHLEVLSCVDFRAEICHKSSTLFIYFNFIYLFDI